MEIMQSFFFEAAHFLPMVSPSHKCKNMHGHSYRLDVHCAGEVGEDGFVVDFFDIEEVVRPLLWKLDHHLLNEMIENPTAENIAIYVGNILASKQSIARVFKVVVWETPNCCATWVR